MIRRKLLRTIWIWARWKNRNPHKIAEIFEGAAGLKQPINIASMASLININNSQDTV
uniref:Uncharacterized protein n=1 Tax=Yersinia ruckeri TaxID=29486 RepID=A0A0A8VLA1_YERRU|nr:hypothetical protein CSF007_13270 [Yersinia ruckeri]